MKQVLQNLKTGQTELADIPCPAVQPGQLLIRSRLSLVSAGTERMLVEFGKAGLIEKARQQPDKVRMVLEKVKTDGLVPTVAAVRSKLDQPLALGYCNVGSVIDVGRGVHGFAVGDCVVSNGKHAEVVAVPMNLCAKVPPRVPETDAVFTVIGAIGLQGIRLANPTVGEAFVVIGLGVIGLVTVQLLLAQGCRVLGIDIDVQKLELARSFGAEATAPGSEEAALAVAAAFSRGRGVDGVLITASTTSNELVHQAAAMCRKRGRIVLVGVTGLALSRADFYEKELSFQVSCSYGPGRYDPSYEEKGQDYPIGFVRWTEQRNFEAILDLMAAGRLDFKSLISHRFPFAEAEVAYSLLGSGEAVLGILFEYDHAQLVASLREQTISILPQRLLQPAAAGKAVVGFIGAGSYGSQVLVPAFKAAGARLKIIASMSGVTAQHAGRKFGFEHVTSDPATIFADPAVTAVAIVTRHDSHAKLVCDALKAGKHVFVEKPLAITAEQLAQIDSAYRSAISHGAAPVLMVGFNRRFSPQIVQIRSMLADLHEPKSLIMTVNAGAVPAGHWTQDPDIGGGRMIGEGCHFVDLLRFLADAPITKLQAMELDSGSNAADDKMTVTIGFADGSVGTLHYLANGHKSFPKERLDVFCAGRILQLDNFSKLRGYGWRGFRSMNLWSQDKGQSGCVQAFVGAIEAGTPSPVPFEELVEVTRATFEVVEQLRG